MQSPAILLGALRSGTTLLRLMLNAHEGISCPGETDFIFDYLTENYHSHKWDCNVAALKQDRIFQAQNLNVPNSTDGREIAESFVAQLRRRRSAQLCLSIHGNADKAASIFPTSKVIHLLRDPRDVARSCIGMGWAGNTYYGVDLWVGTESNWDLAERLFGAGQILEIRYEELVANTEETLKLICAFLDVPYSSAMLTYSANSTYGPPDPSAIEQWKTKLSPREVALAEIKAEPLMIRRGYSLSGYSLSPPTLREQFSLFFSNKSYKWGFARRRYGTANFALEKVTRFLPPLHRMFVQRLSEIDKKYLK